MMEVYTDGACGKDGRGGWAYVIDVPGGPVLEFSGSEPNSTNNKMEMMAVIQALKAHPGKNMLIYSDSQYVVYGATRWIEGWVARDWYTADGKPVKNREYWEAIMNLMGGRKVQFQWVKGHADNDLNNRADRLAQFAARGEEATAKRETRKSEMTYRGKKLHLLTKTELIEALEDIGKKYTELVAEKRQVRL